MRRFLFQNQISLITASMFSLLPSLVELLAIIQISVETKSHSFARDLQDNGIAAIQNNSFVNLISLNTL